MKRKKIPWQKRITKKQLAHIKETTDNGLLWEFKANREAHQKERERGAMEPCWICRDIAVRLGIEE